MDRHIEVELSETGIDRLIDELNATQLRLDRKDIQKQLASAGADEVRIAYSSEKHSAEQGIDVSVMDIKNGYKIIARGDSVAFAEFGAGVYYNPSDNYPERPQGIMGIGEYGKGLGKNKFWTYVDENGNRKFSWGQPMRLGFVNAKARIMQMVKK
jgi:hypothetical protein